MSAPVVISPFGGFFIALAALRHLSFASFALATKKVHDSPDARLEHKASLLCWIIFKDSPPSPLHAANARHALLDQKVFSF